MTFQKIDPTAWKPENEGDEIIGKLLKIETEKGKYKSSLYHIDSDNEGQIVVFGSAVLDDKMTFVNIGDEIKIVFKGKVKGKEQEYNDYDVYIDDDDGSDDTEEDEEEAEQQIPIEEEIA